MNQSSLEPVSIRTTEPEDINRLLELNEAALPAVNSVPFSQMVWYLDQARHDLGLCLVASAGNDIAGFFIGLLAKTDYHSLNYRWFSERFDDFAYIDRVVVDPAFHRRGIAVRFYGRFEEWALGRATRLVCDVNVRPPNPQSMAFHERLGFAEVGRQEAVDGSKEVALLAREI